MVDPEAFYRLLAVYDQVLVVVDPPSGDLIEIGLLPRETLSKVPWSVRAYATITLEIGYMSFCKIVKSNLNINMENQHAKELSE